MRKIKSKNTDQGIITSNGIVIDGDIALSTGLQINKDRLIILRTILAVIASYSTVRILAAFLEFNSIVSILPTILMCLAVAAMTTKYAILKSVGLGYIITQIVYSALSFNTITDGFIVGLDKYLTRAKIPSSDIADMLKKIPTHDRFYSLSRALIFVSTVVALLVAIACIVRFDFAILFASTFPFFEIGLYHGWNPPTLYVIALVLSWIVVISIVLVNHSTNKAGLNNTFAVHRRKKAYYFTSKELKNKFFTVYLSAVAIICAVVFLTSVLFSSLTGFVRPASFKTFRYNITEMVRNFSFSSLENLLADYEGGFNFFSVKSVGGTNGGRLGRQDGISFDGSTALNAKIKYKPSSTLYLRGYVAGKYEDNCWDPIDNDPSSTLKDAFGSDPIQNFNYEMFRQAGLNSYNVENTISIAVVGASRRFAYAPYMTDYLSDTTNEKNETVLPTEEGYVKLRSRKYVLNFEDITQFNGLEMLLNLYSISYLSNTDIRSRMYNSFVRDNYMDVAHSVGLDQAYDNISRRIDPNDKFDRKYVLSCYSAIKNYLDSNYKYDLNPGKTPDGQDFIDNFLRLNPKKCGYCSYFASAGTMLMRMFGFPARYVEGYIVRPDTFKIGSDTKYASLEADITDEAAHAWCEVFIDGIGWLPLEFTPGYGDSTNPNQPPVTTQQSQTVTAPAPVTTSAAVTTLPKTTSASVSTTKQGQGSVSSVTSNSGSGIGSGGSGGSGDHPQNKEEGLSLLAKFIIADVLFLIAVILFVLLHRKYKLKKKFKLTHLKNRNKAVQNIYLYYLKYLSLINISDETNITDEKQAMKLIKSCHKLGLEEITNDLSVLSELAIEAHHSNNTIEDNEYFSALEALKKLSKNVVAQKLSAVGRFSAKWFYGLY